MIRAAAGYARGLLTRKRRFQIYAALICRLDLTPDEYDSFISSPFVDERVAGDDRVALIVVRGSSAELVSPGSLPVVVCAVGAELGGPGPVNADLVMSEHDLPGLHDVVDHAPLAATTLAVLLRSIDALTVEQGLAAESAAYSVLQSGPEFAAWRAAALHVADAFDGPVVEVERSGDELLITLARPHRHNSITAQLRDELHAALAVAVADDSIASVILRGSGPSFCSGGDLGEFGSRESPAIAHVTRLARSPSRLIHRLRDRITVYVHGATFGGGIEMAAFANNVVADPQTAIALPEVGLGLLPGAGGTVSLTRRIGRQRTAALALSGRQIDALTALVWGLVDEIADVAP